MNTRRAFEHAVAGYGSATCHQIAYHTDAADGRMEVALTGGGHQEMGIATRRGPQGCSADFHLPFSLPPPFFKILLSFGNHGGKLAKRTGNFSTILMICFDVCHEKLNEEATMSKQVCILSYSLLNSIAAIKWNIKELSWKEKEQTCFKLHYVLLWK